MEPRRAAIFFFVLFMLPWIACRSLALAFMMERYLWFLCRSLTTQFRHTMLLQVRHKNFTGSAGCSLQKGTITIVDATFVGFVVSIFSELLMD